MVAISIVYGSALSAFEKRRIHMKDIDLYQRGSK